MIIIIITIIIYIFKKPQQFKTKNYFEKFEEFTQSVKCDIIYILERKKNILIENKLKFCVENNSFLNVFRSTIWQINFYDFVIWLADHIINKLSNIKMA